jgi:eukaryotic-like serine/threonine-protein kinase
LIAPSGGEGLRPEATWIPITSGEFSDDKPRFSPSGNLIYFTSDRDGFTCLWAQRLHPQSKRPVGSPFSIQHFHTSRLSLLNGGLGNLEISVAKDKIVFNVGEIAGNIWMADFGGGR